MRKIMTFISLLILAIPAFSLTLQEAQNLALQRNEQLLAAYSKKEVDRYKTYEALSRMLPSVSASYNYVRLDEVPALEMTTFNPMTNSFETREIEMGKLNNYALKIQVQQPIFLWGKLYNSYLISKIGYENSSLDYEQSRKDILYNVKVAYYSALLAKEQVEIAREALNQIQLHYNSVKKRYELGLASNLDLIQVDVKKSDTKRMLISAENSYNVALLNLKNLLGLSLDSDISLEENFKQVEYNFQEEKIIEQALEHDLKLKQLNNNLSILKISQKMLKTKNLPSLFASFGYEYKNPYNFQEKWGGNASFMLLLTADLFKGGSTLTQIKQNKLQQEALQRRYDFYKNMLKLKITRLLSDIKAAKKQIEVSELQVKQAEEAYKAANEQYENGLISNLDFLSTQLMLLQAKLQRNVAIFQYNQKVFELQKIIE